MIHTKRGFTLIELLIVIAILAVLSVAIVLVLNPAELLKQSRDATRISDLGALNSAIALYLTDVSSPNLDTVGACANARETATGATSSFANHATVTLSSSTVVTGAGWVSINFTSISSGAPISKLPIDPVNTYVGGNPLYYGYACTAATLKYELNAFMESAKFSAGGSADVESNTKDGGDNAGAYEIGNSLTQ